MQAPSSIRTRFGVSASVAWFAFLSLASCRLLLGIEDPETLDRSDGGLDGAFDARFDARVDGGGIDARPDGACEPCGTECVFTSTDVRHCGACGNACTVDSPSTATCALGRCVAILAEVNGAVTKPIVSGGAVYVGNTYSNGIVSVPIKGGTPSTIVTGDAGVVIAADVASVYWTQNGRIFASALDGGSAAPLTPSTTTLTTPVGTTVDATGLTFASDSTIRFLDIHGGDPQIIATAQSTIAGLTSDAINFYLGDNYGYISSVSRDGGTPATLATSQYISGDIAVSATDIYWVYSSSLRRMPIGGGAYTTVASGIDHILVAGSTLYGRTSNGIVSVPLIGLVTSLTPTVIGPKNAIPEALDETSLYWIDNSTTPGVGRIMKLTPR